MAMKYRAGYCDVCAENQKLERKSGNHVLHLILSIITLGWWVIIWILVAVSSEPWTCSKCGTKKVTVLR